MRWSYKGRSSNLEDRRGLSLGRTGTGVGLGGALLLLALSYVFNIDLLSIFSDSGAGYGNPPAGSRSAPVTDGEEEPMVHFVSFVLDDAQQTWNRLLGPRYRDAKLVLFRRGRALRLRDRARGCRTVLLPSRSKGVHRPLVLR